MLRYRLRPRGFAAFVRTARAQHRHFPGTKWPEAVRRAWEFGPIR